MSNLSLLSRSAVNVDRKDFVDPGAQAVLQDYIRLVRTHVTSEPMLVAMIALPPSTSSDLSYNDVLLCDDPIISQVTRDTSKPGRARDDGAECWVVHSTASYARKVMEEVAAEGGGKVQVAQRAGDDLYQVCLF